jgi:hypothetical protein
VRSSVEKTLWLVAGAVGATLLMLALQGIFAREARPPIIVKGGSIDFYTGKAWKGSGKKWKPDHGNGKSVTGYEVSVFGSAQCSWTMTGSTIKFVYEGKTFTITTEKVANKYEPVIAGDENLSYILNQNKLTFGDEDKALTSVTIVRDDGDPVSCGAPDVVLVVPLGN